MSESLTDLYAAYQQHPDACEETDVAQRLIFDLVVDLRDRSGLRGMWDSIDADVQEEIFAAWIVIARKHIDGPGANQ